MNSSPDHPEDERDQLPESLRAALRELESEGNLFVPPTLDETILKRAEAHFQATHVPARQFQLWTVWRLLLAGAVAVLITAILFLLLGPQHSGPSLAREDINHDGHVDILDALALAKSVQANSSSDKRFDQNGDGKLDDSDVKAVAAAAVRLNPKPRS
jgi:hypothetical protein